MFLPVNAKLAAYILFQRETEPANKMAAGPDRQQKAGFGTIAPRRPILKFCKRDKPGYGVIRGCSANGRA
jgi:hypothetical protein